VWREASQADWSRSFPLYGAKPIGFKCDRFRFKPLNCDSEAALLKKINMKNRVLSIDGGGMKALATAQILIALEQRLKGRIADYIDFASGTSAGGLTIAMLLHPKKYTAQDISDLFEQYGSTIFSTNALRTALSYVYGSKYSAKGIESVLAKYMGNTRLSELTKPAIITAYDLVRRNVKIFAQTDYSKYGSLGDFLLKDVCRATSAAQTYFKPAYILSCSGQPYHLIDGGNSMNNPALAAYSEIRAKPHNVHILSLGTGSVEKPYHHMDANGDIDWIKPSIDIMMSSSSEVVDFHLQNIFSEYAQNYDRIQWNHFGKASVEMDCATPANNRALIELGKHVAIAYSSTLDKVADSWMAKR
jgi:patatin-like phospholipase/acyl hydrolase